MNWTQEKMQERIVRYAHLIPCKNAFVDTRTPGSDQKENFTLIGPGVSENPNQHIHIAEAHGFNIGGARQPPGCLNSQHSHITAEVFIVHNSRWRFNFGVNANEGYVELNKGDTISIPTNMFRGFENIGNETGFLFAILGKDNPGKVTWAPTVFNLAKKYGLILLKDGKLIDTTIGETVPENAEYEIKPTEEEIQSLATPDEKKLKQSVAYYDQLKNNPQSSLAENGITEAAVIMPKITQDGFSDAAIIPWWEHEFHVRKLSIDAKRQTKWHKREEEVLFVQDGELTVLWQENAAELSIVLQKGDTMTFPKNIFRSFQNQAVKPIEIFIVRGGENIKKPIFKT